MNLLYPIGLFALAGIIVPVLIHLWNIKKGKTLKIGSIMMLGESARISSSSWRITDWLLFILRCLLLVLISFLLAKPHFSMFSKAEQQAWVMVKKAALKQAYKGHRQQIDSLLKLGVEIHDFNVGFKMLSLADTLKNDQVAATDLSYIALLKQLDNQLPAGFKVYVYADKQLHHFVGELPRLHFDLRYSTIQTSDTLKNWSVAFNGKTYQANSSPSRTSYTTIDSASTTVPMHVLVAPLNSPDANYVKGVLSAIVAFTNRKIVVQAWDMKADTGAVAGFWLNEQPLPAGLGNKLTKGANLLAYKNGKPENILTNINLADGPISYQHEASLYKRIAYQHKGRAITVWDDGFGTPLLSRTKITGINHYTFYGRFDPQWTDLVWTSQFVKAMLPIVVPDHENNNFGFEDSADDQRQLALQQPVAVTNDGASSSLKASSKTDLAPIFWIAACLLLILERSLSFRKPIQVSHVKN